LSKKKAGGQALPHGVMMRQGARMAAAVRQKDGTIRLCASEKKEEKKSKVRKLPFFRGLIAIGQAFSAMIKPSVRGVPGLRASLLFALILSVVCLALSIPGVLLAEAYRWPDWVLTIWELVALVIPTVIALRLPGVRRTLAYHGAEHKAIHCLEAGLELTPENAQTCSRLHPRCGTSVAVFVLATTLLAYLFVPYSWPMWAQELVFLVVAAVSVAVAYESMRYAADHNNCLSRILTAPSFLAQRLTTREPDLAQLECAVCALKAVLEESEPVACETEKKTG